MFLDFLPELRTSLYWRNGFLFLDFFFLPIDFSESDPLQQTFLFLALFPWTSGRCSAPSMRTSPGVGPFAPFFFFFPLFAAKRNDILPCPGDSSVVMYLEKALRWTLEVL